MNDEPEQFVADLKKYLITEEFTSSNAQNAEDTKWLSRAVKVIVKLNENLKAMTESRNHFMAEADEHLRQKLRDEGHI